MATITFLRFNHDYTGVLAADPEGFMQVLIAYLSNPTQETMDELISWGVIVMPSREALPGLNEESDGSD